MTHLHDSKRPTHYVRGALAIGLVAIVLTGCGDASVAPRSTRRAAVPDRPVLARYDGTRTFTYVPSYDNTMPLGDHKITLAAWGICDPAVSSYGPGTWDDACTVLTRPIDITATTYTDAFGHPFVQFQPPLRFVPGRVSTLYLTDKKASLDLLSKIVYCPDSGACVDEALSDPSLLTFRNTQGYLYRRIKHFSGYNVAALEDDVLPIEY